MTGAHLGQTTWVGAREVWPSGRLTWLGVLLVAAILASPVLAVRGVQASPEVASKEYRGSAVFVSESV